MQVVCLDLEGVLVPEIWIECSKRTGIAELARTTRDEPDYDKLMRFRIELLARHGLKLADIQRVIDGGVSLAAVDLGSAYAIEIDTAADLRAAEAAVRAGPAFAPRGLPLAV